MGTGTGLERIGFPVSEVPWAEIQRRFGVAHRAEKLPTKEINSARWFASEVSCGALVPASRNRARLKGAVTLPEWRGMGHGRDVLVHRLHEAHASGFREVEVFTRHPAWFERHGFHVLRMTKWGTPVMVATMDELLPLIS